MLGNLSQTRITGGVVTDYQYGALNRLDLMRHDDGDNVYDQLTDTLLSEFDYTVRADGKQTAVDEKVFDGTTTKATRVDWLYDDIGRPTQEDYNADGASLDFTADYLFDLVGNRLEKSVDQGRDSTVDETTDYTYDANDRLITEAKDGTGTANDRHMVYTYDATQQIAKDVYTDATLTTPVTKTDYAYNLQGRMSKTEIDSDGAGDLEDRIEYEYDAAGIRLAKTVTNDSDADGDLSDETPDRTDYLVDHCPRPPTLSHHNFPLNPQARPCAVGVAPENAGKACSFIDNRLKESCCRHDEHASSAHDAPHPRMTTQLAST